MILANENEEIFSFFAYVLLFKFKKSHYNTGTAARNLCPRNLLVKLYYKIKKPTPSHLSFRCWNHDLSALLCHWFKRNISNPPNRFFFKKLICNFRRTPNKNLDRVLWCGINSSTTKVQTNIMSKSDNNNVIITSVALL